MAEKKIEVDFDLDTGEVRAEGFNFEGMACSLDLGALMTAVGKVTKRKLKPQRERQVRRIQRNGT